MNIRLSSKFASQMQSKGRRISFSNGSSTFSLLFNFSDKVALLGNDYFCSRGCDWEEKTLKIRRRDRRENVKRQDGGYVEGDQRAEEQKLCLPKQLLIDVGAGGHWGHAPL